MIKKYPILIHKDESSDWSASFVDTNVHVIEESLEEVLAECQDAFEAGMTGETELPDPTPLARVIESEEGREANSVMLVDIDTTFFEDPTERKSTSAKRSQWQLIDAAARKAGKTRSAFLVDSAVARAREIDSR